MKKSYWLCTICIITVICISSIVIIFKHEENKGNNEKSNKSIENLMSDNTNEKKIENIKQDLGYNNTDSEIYEVKTEYDGREVISIKPNIQYNVAMAGVIKNKKPEFSEIDNLLKQAPNKSGIWIEKNSREKFLNIINSISNIKYTINSEGYLEQEQTSNFTEMDKTIEKIINSKKIYSISINSIAYLIDEITGNIEEYPFEEIDPRQSYELFETEKASLYVVTENKLNKLKNKDIIEEIITNIKAEI